LFLRGIENYYHNQYQKAITLFDNSLEKNKNKDWKIDTLYYQTLSYIELNRVVAAKENIKKLKNMGYEFGNIYWELGQLYLNKEEQFDSPFYNEAKDQLEKAKMFGINSPRFHSDLAMAYQGLGKVEKAAREYELALNEEGEAGDYINVANLYKKENQLQKAIKNYKKALEIDPEITSVYFNLGSIYLKQENYQKAIEFLTKGVKIQPSFAALRYRLGNAYYLNNNLSKAREEFNKVIDLNENAYRAYYYLGKIYTQEDKLQKAIYNYEQAIKHNPNYVSAYIALGDIYLEQKNYYKAISQYSTAIEKNDN
jgi:tetratricopeptide (TPR) repeat protein